MPIALARLLLTDTGVLTVLLPSEPAPNVTRPVSALMTELNAPWALKASTELSIRGSVTVVVAVLATALALTMLESTATVPLFAEALAEKYANPA